MRKDSLIIRSDVETLSLFAASFRAQMAGSRGLRRTESPNGASTFRVDSFGLPFANETDGLLIAVFANVVPLAGLPN